MRSYAQQKAALTRTLRAPENKRRECVIREVQRVKVEWFAKYGVHNYPDDWSRWQRALTDVGVYDDIEDV
jgi:hypothetical protein